MHPTRAFIFAKLTHANCLTFLDLCFSLCAPWFPEGSGFQATKAHAIFQHAPILFTALPAWLCFYLMHSGCCVALPLSCLQRCVVWLFYLVYSGCCMALPLSGLKHLLSGFASILCTGAAAWHCPYRPVYSACCVAWPLSCLRGLLCGFAFVLCTAVAARHCPYPVYGAVWHCPYPVHIACCLAFPLSRLQRLLCGFASILCTAVAV